MTYSPLATRIVNTPNQASRNGVTPDIIAIHHFAGTDFESVIEQWRTGEKDGSCHIAISNEGVIVALVPEELNAYSLANDDWDNRCLVIEIENQSAGPDWTISDAAYEAAARVTAEWVKRRGISYDSILGHNQIAALGGSYSTWCPGPVERVNRIRNRAQQINTPQPLNVKGKRIRMFTFMRKASTGGIVLINGEKGTYRSITGGEWNSYAANGWKFANVSDSEWNSTLDKLTPEGN